MLSKTQEIVQSIPSNNAITKAQTGIWVGQTSILMAPKANIDTRGVISVYIQTLYKTLTKYGSVPPVRDYYKKLETVVNIPDV